MGLRCLSLGTVLVAVVAAVPNVMVLAPYLPGIRPATAEASAASSPAIQPSQSPVELIAANLLYRQENPTAALAYFNRLSPDLLILSEFTPRWREKLRDLERSYPFFAIRPRWNAKSNECSPIRAQRRWWTTSRRSG